LTGALVRIQRGGTICNLQLHSLATAVKEDVMHDLDRTSGEFWEVDGGELELSEWMGEEESYGNEMGGAEMGGVFSEADEMELAAELLEVSDEAELEQFLGGLIKSVGQAVGGSISPAVGRTLGGMLKGVAKRALPIAGGALGNLVAPGIGGAVGSKVASAAGSLFGLELEGLSGEDQEFEVARHFVRLAGEAAENAAQAPEGAAPQAAAQSALADAAAQHAPGLLRQNSMGAGNGTGRPRGAMSDSPRMTGGKRSGRWMRRGNRIVLYGL
jgi:hypothetical protein